MLASGGEQWFNRGLTDSGYKCGREGIVGEAEQDARLAHARVADQQQLEEQVVRLLGHYSVRESLVFAALFKQFAITRASRRCFDVSFVRIVSFGRRGSVLWRHCSRFYHWERDGARGHALRSLARFRITICATPFLRRIFCKIKNALLLTKLLYLLCCNYTHLYKENAVSVIILIFIQLQS